jgi:hypothetical protein
LVYFTHAYLMRESENSVHACAETGSDPVKRVCAQLCANPRRYAVWISLHDVTMREVAVAYHRDSQIRRLRKIATLQIHRAALVRHLRANEVGRKTRERLLGEYYGALDPICATLTEHRAYSSAVPSQVCVRDLLEQGDDREGLDLLEAYQREYGIYFALHCERRLAIAEGRASLLTSLLPEVHAGLRRLRYRLSADDRPTWRRQNVKPWPVTSSRPSIRTRGSARAR